MAQPPVSPLVDVKPWREQGVVTRSLTVEQKAAREEKMKRKTSFSLRRGSKSGAQRNEGAGEHAASLVWGSGSKKAKKVEGLVSADNSHTSKV